MVRRPERFARVDEKGIGADPMAAVRLEVLPLEAEPLVAEPVEAVPVKTVLMDTVRSRLARRVS